MDKEMGEWVTNEDRKRRENAQEKRSTDESSEKENAAKKIRFNQERENTAEDRAFQEDIFGPVEPESKRKE
eukprot:10425795-Karenia_brevis.AAC.1